MSAHETVAVFAAICSSGLLVSLAGFGAWIVRKLTTHDAALAVIVQQVNPPGGKSLRDIVQEIQIEQARIQAQTLKEEHK